MSGRQIFYPYGLPPPLPIDDVDGESKRFLSEFDRNTIRRVHHLNIMIALCLPDHDRNEMYSHVHMVEKTKNLINQMGTTITDWANTVPKAKTPMCMTWIRRSLGSFEGLSRNLKKYLDKQPPSHSKSMWVVVSDNLQSLVGVMSMMTILPSHGYYNQGVSTTATTTTTMTEQEGGGFAVELDVSHFG